MLRILTFEDMKLIDHLFGDRLEDYTLVYDTIIDNGFKNDDVVVYGELEGNDLVSLLLHNHNNLTYFSSEVREVACYKKLLDELEYGKVTCESQFAVKFQDLIDFDEVEDSWFGYLHANLNPVHDDDSIRFDCLNDTPELITDDYFELSIAEDEGIVGRATHIANGNGPQKMYCLSRNGKAISTAMIVMVQSHSAIVHGVITCIDERRKGLAGFLLGHIGTSLFEDGKKMYLFYSNPIARNLYLKLGTREVGSWNVMYLD